MHKNIKLPKSLNNLKSHAYFHEWCETIGDEYFLESQNSIPINIDKYFELRDIKEVKYSSDIVSKARLTRIPSGFLIQLNKNKIRTSKQVNYYTAHEIAHTFFFRKINNDFFHVEDIPSSDDLEYACDRIARCLLIPKAPLVDKLSQYPSINDEKFSLKMINDLCKYFSVTHTLLLRRITQDLGIWKKFLLIRFQLFNRTSKEWRIREIFFNFSDINGKKLFIPMPDKFKANTDPRKYPKAKDGLLNFVERCFKEIHASHEERINIDSNDITGKPLESFFNYYSKKKFNKCLISKVKFKKYDYLNLLLRLDDKFIDKLA